MARVRLFGKEIILTILTFPKPPDPIADPPGNPADFTKQRVVSAIKLTKKTHCGQEFLPQSKKPMVNFALTQRNGRDHARRSSKSFMPGFEKGPRRGPFPANPQEMGTRRSPPTQDHSRLEEIEHQHAFIKIMSQRLPCHRTIRSQPRLDLSDTSLDDALVLGAVRTPPHRSDPMAREESFPSPGRKDLRPVGFQYHRETTVSAKDVSHESTDLPLTRRPIPYLPAQEKAGGFVDDHSDEEFLASNFIFRPVDGPYLIGSGRRRRLRPRRTLVGNRTRIPLPAIRLDGLADRPGIEPLAQRESDRLRSPSPLVPQVDLNGLLLQRRIYAADRLARDRRSSGVEPTDESRSV